MLFTDIEGSTRLWETERPAMEVALPRHDALIRHCIGAHGGHVFKTVGDAFCVAFHTAPEALAAALEVLQSMLAQVAEGNRHREAVPQEIGGGL